MHMITFVYVGTSSGWRYRNSCPICLSGRVGTRRLGMPDWGGMIQDIKDRERSGLDIVNV